MIKSFKERLNAIKQTHSYRAEKVKTEFVRGITRVMRQKGITNTVLAERVETSNAYITKALRGDCNFTIDSMAKIAHGVGATIHIHVADNSASVRWLEMHTCKDEPGVDDASLDMISNGKDTSNIIDLKGIKETIRNVGCKLYA